MTRTPSIVCHGLQPLPITIGAVTLRPVTIGDALTLDRIGSPVLSGATATGADLAHALFLLSRPASASFDLGPAAIAVGASDWQRTVPPEDLSLLGIMLHGLIAAMFAPLAQTRVKREEHEVVEEAVGDEDGNGLGWLLNLAMEMIEINAVADYQAALELPVCTALVLRTAARIRSGEEWADPSYVTLDRIEAEESAAAPAPPRRPRGKRNAKAHANG